MDPSNMFAQLCACLSEAAITGVEDPRAMRLIRSIQGYQVMILVD
jgi:hypothetical protein